MQLYRYYNGRRGNTSKSYDKHNFSYSELLNSIRPRVESLRAQVRHLVK